MSHSALDPQLAGPEQSGDRVARGIVVGTLVLLALLLLVPLAITGGWLLFILLVASS